MSVGKKISKVSGLSLVLKREARARISDGTRGQGNVKLQLDVREYELRAEARHIGSVWRSPDRHFTVGSFLGGDHEYIDVVFEGTTGKGEFWVALLIKISQRRSLFLLSA